MTESKTRILCLSNGHGEDLIATRIAEVLLAQGIEIAALPIVGEGKAYRDLGIEIICPTRTMPSGGFIYMDAREFIKDLRGGLGELTLQQWQALRQWAPRCDLILAAGDIVVLGLSVLASRPFAFVGTAKSDYYLGGEPSDYTFLERWLLSRPACQAVYPRDELTTRNLQPRVPRAIYLGNPMMDRLEPTGQPLDLLPKALTILLLPGSRPPEAYRNLGRMLAAIEYLPRFLDAGPLAFVVAQAGSLDSEELAATLPGWQLEGNRLCKGTLTVLLQKGRFADCLHSTDLAMAMAGTATEQCVGMGKPVVTMPGDGPQFTYRFAEAQTRLLGESIQLVTEGPQAVARRIRMLLEDEGRLACIRRNGEARMGKPGAAGRIAEHLLKILR